MPLWRAAKQVSRLLPALSGQRLVTAGVVALLGIVLSVAVWVRAESDRRTELTSMLGSIADRTTSRIEWQMQREVDGVRFLTTLVQSGAVGGAPAWPLQAGLILQEYPGLDWVAWVLPDSSVRGFVGRDTSVSMDPEVLRQTRFQLASQATTIHERWNDAYEYHVFAPVTVDTIRMGVIVAQARVDSLWLRRQPSLMGTYTVQLLGEDDRLIPLRVVPDSLAPPWMRMRRTITSPAGSLLRMDVVPPDDFVRQVSSGWPLMFLLTGAFLSFAIGALLIQFMRLRDFSSALERTNRDLDEKLTDLSRRDEELRRLNDDLGERVQVRTGELSRALREVETFNHSVSHDLRSPIGAILNFSVVLEEDHGDRIEPDGRRLLERIRGAAARANQLLDSLAEFSAAEVQPGAIRPLDMKDLAERAYAEALGRESLPEGVRFEVDPLPLALGDPELVHRVFVNLIGNALKYSRDRVARIVRVAGEPGPRENTYRVTDNGCGFDPARASEAFEAFRRLHGNEVEGSGLGLAIVAKIIGRLGGRVWAESDGVSGATFHFTLPPAEGAVS